MWRWTARFDGALACVICVIAVGATLAVPGPARGAPPLTVAAGGAGLKITAGQAVAPGAVVRQAARGVSVEIVEAPERFVAGASPETVTVVASKAGGQDCLKVRWSMVLQLEGLTLEQVQIDRVEENGSFPVDVDEEGGTARVTDEQLDPGTLCRDRTVTARYRVNVANDVRNARLTLLAEAYDSGLRLLERDGTTLSVVGAAGRDEPSPSPSAGRQDTEPDPGAGGSTPAGPAGQDVPADQAAASDDRNGLPLAWFLVGGLMVFLGLSLLLNMRWRNRNTPEGPDLPRLDGPVVAPSLSRYRTVPRRARGW